MGPQQHVFKGLLANAAEGEICDSYSEGTDASLSRCTSLEQLPLPDGYVEERFRVDRRKLEAMIEGCPPDPWETEIAKIPIGDDGRIMAADEFFQRVMDMTNTEIRYPKFLKIGAKNKKDPHVCIIGPVDSVMEASSIIRSELEPQKNITMKMDVSWTCHSHIIGKGGNTIQPVGKRTGVSIHFPDGNKNNEVNKSNQVSINSRREELSGIEEARAAIRELTPLAFTFNIPQVVLLGFDPSLVIIQVHNKYKVQAELKVVSDMVKGSVKDTEWNAIRVKEATLYLLYNLCGNLALQIPVSMSVEISPQHHSYMFGRGNEILKKIILSTATKITLPDYSDQMLSALQRTQLLISGSIENVYDARQKIVGCLPLVLMFDLMPEFTIDQDDLMQLTHTLNVAIQAKPQRPDGRIPVVIKARERDAGNIYEAWRLLTYSSLLSPVVRIPPSYQLNTLLSSVTLPQSASASTALPTHHIKSPTQCYGENCSCNLYGHLQTPLVPLPTNSLCYALEKMKPNQQNASSCSTCYQSSQESNNNYSYANNVDSNYITTPRPQAMNPFDTCSTSPYSSPTSQTCSTLSSSISSNNSGDNMSSVEKFKAIISSIPDRRAPGCEKKSIEVAISYGLLDNKKRLEANKAMRQPVVSSERRYPTLNWAGFGFSKSVNPVVDINCNEVPQDYTKSSFEKSDSSFNDICTNGNCGTTCVEMRPRRMLLEKTTDNKTLDIATLLIDLHMDQYIDLFTEKSIDFESLLNLTEQDLKALGITAYGHRMKLLMAIKSLDVIRES